ncbi:MAG: YihY/virulence factor BrkB family protein [Parvibaculaceae bacterium]
MSPARFWSLARDSVSAWLEDSAPSMGAAIAFYTLFSLAPLLVIVTAVAGFFFGAEAARGELFGQISGLIGPEGAVAIQGMVESARRPDESIAVAVAGLAFMFIGATAVFGELQSALDRIWRTPAPPSGLGVWGFIRGRVLSFGMVLGVAFLLLVSLVASAGISAVGNFWSSRIGGWELVLQVVNLAVSLLLFTGAFALIYRYIPRARIAWRDVWVGAAVTSFLFTAGKLLIGLYIGKSGVASGYGAAGSLAALMIWVYYSAQAFLLGAECTWVYAHRRGSRMGLSAAPAVGAGPVAVTPAVPTSGPPSLSQALQPVVTLGLALLLGVLAGLVRERVEDRQVSKR